MKKILSLVAGIAITSFSFGQVGSVAPDFTVTDMNGNSHHLYEYLDAGKVVVLDVSAVWCGPCWTFHQGHYLEELYNDIGQGGTGEAVILFYEGDASTDDASLSGNGGNSLGNWLDGSSYPFINESPLTLSSSAYWPEGFPTVNVISPNDKKIKADVWNYTSTQSIKDVIEQHYPDGTASIENNELVETTSATLFPNPSNGQTAISFNSAESGQATIQIMDLAGKMVFSKTFTFVAGENQIDLDLTELVAGNYLAQFADTKEAIAPIKIQITK